jgi:3-oxoacyl-[acyl-carrier-protein] synthase-3
MSAVIIQTGSYLPKQIVRNEDLTQFPPVGIALISQKTGVKARRHAAPEEVTSDLGFAAARRCLVKACLAPTDVDALILSTSSPDRIQPATATRVQHLLGATNAYAFDINSVCSGGIYALHLAASLIDAGRAQHVLVVAAEVYSRILNERDFSTYPYFGDGAGAILLSAAGSGPTVRGCLLGSDGSGCDVIQVPGGGSMLPFAKAQANDVYFKMRGKDVYDFAVTQGERVIRQLLAGYDISISDVASFIAHQANINILKELAHRLNVCEDQFYANLQEYGNTASASTLIAFDEFMIEKRPAPGSKVVLVAFGGGLSWAACLLQF